MSSYFISINQFAEFSVSSLASKKRILKQQISPNKFLIPWYQKAKGAIKKYLLNVNDSSPLESAIAQLELSVPKNSRQVIDKRVSIEAIEIVKGIKLPKLLSSLQIEAVSQAERAILLNGVNIKIAPDIILRGKYKGKIVYGAIKIHICKGAPFDLQQSKIVSGLLYKFLKKHIAKSDEIVMAELCLSLDVFSERVVPATEVSGKDMVIIKGVCEEVKNLWPI